MKALSFLAVIALLSVVHFACNPECQSLQGVKLSTNMTLENYEIYIDATPRESLKNRKVFFDEIFVPSVYNDSVGLIFKVPTGQNPKSVRIEDPDCLEVYTFPFQVVDANYFSTIENFVPPIPPEIVIPTINIPFPQSVDNAWLSPDEPEYCLWFTMYKDIKPNGDTVATNLIDPGNSFEQATCCCKRSDPNLPFAMNRMGGIVDVAGNRIEIYIDRTNQAGGDIEYFTGRFIDRQQVPQYANNTGKLTCPLGDPNDPNCAGGNTCVGQVDYSPQLTQNNMMLLTSQKTGRQIVVYQFQ